jgi:hypothetical protein
MVNLQLLKELNCQDNQLALLEGIESFINLIKNNKKIRKKLYYDFVDSDDSDDSDDFIEFKKLFDSLIKCKKNDEINKYIEEIEKMLVKINGFQQYILK